MKQEMFRYDALQQQLPPLSETGLKVRVNKAFIGVYWDEINPTGLFLCRFNRIPNISLEKRINCQKALGWLSEHFSGEWKDFHYHTQGSGNRQGTPELYEVIICLFEDLLVCLDFRYSRVRYLFRETPSEKVEEITCGIRKFRKRESENKGRIWVLVTSGSGLELKDLPIKTPRTNLQDHYNADFMEVHKAILKRVTKSGKGLVILHGKPGTGKTSYIRYLAAVINKKVIFLPPGMAGAITHPGLIELLIDNPDSLLVIEDAEQLVVSRESSGGSAVSAILNITDGLLSDCLNIQVICSFNTDISRIDPALLRKGRLIAKYEFRELTADKADCLSTRLGFRTDLNIAKTLAAIYHPEEPDYMPKEIKPRIGFT